MAHRKISQLADGAPAQDADEVLLRRGSGNRREQVAALRTAQVTDYFALTANGSVQVPAWATKVLVTAVAPGGGGGGVPAFDNSGTGGGGSSGMSVFLKSYTVTPGLSITATCSNWNGGAGNSAAAGSSGANLVLSGALNLSLNGGAGGAPGDEVAGNEVGGAGGASSGAGSQAGEKGIGFSNKYHQGGRGGGSPFGPGPHGPAHEDGSAPGNSAVFPGCGGSGAIQENTNPVTNLTGGAGGPGRVELIFLP